MKKSLNKEKSKKDIKRRFENYNENYTPKEIDWGEPVGKERISFYSENNIKAIKESIKQLKEGKVIVKTMEELEKMENK